MEKINNLSGATSDEGLDMLAKILPHLDAIIHDADYDQLKDRMKADKELTLSDIMGEAYTVIAMKNRPALYGIVGAVMGKTEKEVAAQPLEETLSVFQGVMGSRVLDFFIFCARTAVRL